MKHLIDLFFLTFIINILISIYSIYTYFDNIFFHNMQGSKLKLKKTITIPKGDDMDK